MAAKIAELFDYYSSGDGKIDVDDSNARTHRKFKPQDIEDEHSNKVAHEVCRECFDDDQRKYPNMKEAMKIQWVKSHSINEHGHFIEDWKTKRNFDETRPECRRPTT